MPLTRRAAVAAGLPALGSVAAGCVAGPDGRPPGALAARPDFVLVHGAWHGGWCWRDVSRRLTAAGHRVFAPTLTGLGDRAHLRVPVPDLSLHIRDVLALIESEELSGFVLAGHSYGGMVITAVADQLRDRIAAIVYLDAALPADGQSMITQGPDTTPASARAALAGLRQLAPDGIWMQPLPPAALGVAPGDTAATAWLARRMTAHPLPSWTEPVRLVRGGSEGLRRTYVHCTAPVLQQASFAAHAARIRAGGSGPGWSLRTLATGHEAMVTDPDGVARLLLEAASPAA